MEILLTRNKKTLVDTDDYLKFNSYKWCYSKGYATRRNKDKTQYLHKIIMNCPIEFSVDHINGNTLDNRKSNLRICKHNQNTKNRKVNKNKLVKYKGVDFDKRYKTYRARIRINYKHVYLGNFNTAKKAANAYDIAAIKYHGEFAKTNKMLGLL